jgi:hypothetical protein
MKKNNQIKQRKWETYEMQLKPGYIPKWQEKIEIITGEGADGDFGFNINRRILAIVFNEKDAKIMTMAPGLLEENRELKEELNRAYNCLQNISNLIYEKSGSSFGVGMLGDFKKWKKLLDKIWA